MTSQWIINVMSSDNDSLWASTPSLKESAAVTSQNKPNVPQRQAKPPFYKTSSIEESRYPTDVTARSLDSVKLYERGRGHDGNVTSTDDDESMWSYGNINQSLDSISSFSRNLNENDLDKRATKKITLSDSRKRLNDEEDDDSYDAAPPAYFELVARENTL